MAHSTIPGEPSPGTPLIGGGLRDTALTLAVLNQVLAGYGSRDFALRLWDGTTVPPDSGQECRFTLALNRPGVLRRTLLPPNELALGEAYLDGDFEIEGDIVAAMGLSDAFERLAMGPAELLGLARQVMALPKDGSRNGGNGRSGPDRQRASFGGTEHSRERDRKVVTYHYDTGNEFFKLFLDRRMIYSCGYFPTGQEDLDTAQEAKLEHICRKLRLKPGERLLDIGCGWGGLVTYAAERFGVEALGITLSQPQADLANERIAAARLSERCRAMILDYRDLASQGPFDKIVSVGMVEHVGRAKLPEYFESAWRGLKPSGLFLNHGITCLGRDWHSCNPLDRYLFLNRGVAYPAGARPSRNPLDRHIFGRGTFTWKYVFPDGEMQPLGDMLGIAERVGFEVRDVESLREHYVLTLRHWVRRLEANRERALAQVGERTYRVWRLYMAGCSHEFLRSRLSVHQTLLSKPDQQSNSGLPMSRADLYA